MDLSMYTLSQALNIAARACVLHAFYFYWLRDVLFNTRDHQTFVAPQHQNVTGFLPNSLKDHPCKHQAVDLPNYYLSSPPLAVDQEGRSKLFFLFPVLCVCVGECVSSVFRFWTWFGSRTCACIIQSLP